MTRTVHVRIEGRVQRVGYRMWTEWNAQELGLSGWVRNRLDGAVEAVFSGPEEAVEEMLERAKDGPLDAAVTNIQIMQDGGTEQDGFDVLPTV